MQKVTCLSLFIIQSFLFSANAQQHHWMHLTTSDGLVNNDVRTVAVQDSLNIWIGTTNGLSHFDGNSFTNYTIANSNLVDNDIYMIKFNNQNIYIFTHTGLSVFDGINFTNYPSYNNVTLQYLDDAVVDHNGNLWMCNQTDVFMYDGASFTHYPNEGSSSIAVDSSNRIYILPLGSIYPTSNVWYRIFDGNNWNSDSISQYNYSFQAIKIDESESNQLIAWHSHPNFNKNYYFAEVTYPFSIQSTSFTLNGVNVSGGPELYDFKLDKNNIRWAITPFDLFSGSDTLLYKHTIPNMNPLCMDIEDDVIVIGTHDGIFLGNINPTSVLDNEQDDQMLIYPNPSSGIFTIDSYKEIIDLQIYDMQGRELVNQSINKRYKTSIDLSKYNNGFFVVRVQTKEMIWSTQKVALFK